MNPFAQLMGATPGRLPVTASATLVVQGQRLPSGRKITHEQKAAILEGDEDQDHEDQLRAIAATKRKVAARARHKRYRSKPEAQAKERARMDATKERRRELYRAWVERNRGKVRAYKSEWQRKARLQRPEVAEAERVRASQRPRLKAKDMTPEQLAARREYQRQYRLANRDHINATVREWKARKAAKQLLEDQAP